MTDVTAAEARLQQHADAHAATLDTLQTAVAIFGPDQKLSFYNKAFVRLWACRKPSSTSIRAKAKSSTGCATPASCRSSATTRPGSAAGWRYTRNGARERASEDTWHMPGGQTIRVVTQPHPFGGLTFLYETSPRG